MKLKFICSQDILMLSKNFKHEFTTNTTFKKFIGHEVAVVMVYLSQKLLFA